MSPEGEDFVLDRALAIITERGLAALSFDGLVEECEESEIDPAEFRARFPNEKEVLQSLAVRTFRRVKEHTLEAIANAKDGEAALAAFVRAQVEHYTANLSAFRLNFAVRQVHGYERFDTTDEDQRKRLLPEITPALDAVEAKLIADRGVRELPGGLHPRRLAFIAQLMASGIMTVKGVSVAIGSPLRHDDTSLLLEAGRALAGPMKALRQLSALNEVAGELVRIRTEASLRARVPQFMVDSLELETPILALRTADGDFDRDVPGAAREAFAQGTSRVEKTAEGFVLAAPVRYEGDVVGVVVGTRAASRDTDERDLARLDTFASLVGLALENVRLYEDLQTQLETRTKKLADAQLRLAEAEKMAALGKLVAGVVHEMNSPLGTVQSSQVTLLRAVARLADDPKPALFAMVKECAEHIGVGVKRISEIVTQLKRFSRLDAAEIEEMNVAVTLRDAVDLVGRSTIELDLGAEELPRVRCHAARIAQVFTNVLDNATKAAGEGGKVVVTARREGAAAVRITVTDDGRGIAAEDLPHVFEPGFTAKGGRVRAGLGLATAYQIVADHKGEIRLASEVGRGTTVTITLPIS